MKIGKNSIFENIVKDGIIVARESRYVANIFLPNKLDNSKHDETEVLMSMNIPKFVSDALFGMGSSAVVGREVKVKNNKVDDNSTWFFINGVCTNEELLEKNCQYLSKIFGRTIIGIHNPTNGIIADLFECTASRLDETKLEAVSLVAAARIIVELNTGKKVKLIAHSQGGLIARNVLRKLLSENADVKDNLEVFTFSSAASDEYPIDGVIQEHFINEHDYIARIGLGAPEYRPHKLWERKGGTGHFLNKSYLTAFARGDFCNEESKLYGYLREKERATKSKKAAVKVTV